MPGEEPGHHGDGGALEPLGPARYRLQLHLRASLAGPGSSNWLLTGTEPVFILVAPLGLYTKPGYNKKPSFFKTGHLGKLETV